MRQAGASPGKKGGVAGCRQTQSSKGIGEKQSFWLEMKYCVEREDTEDT